MKELKPFLLFLSILVCALAVVALLPTPTLAQNTAIFPGAIPTQAQLGVAANQAASTLTSGVAATDTTLSVLSSAPFKVSSFVTVDSEIMAVCAIPDGTHLTLGVSACPNVDGRGIDLANGGGAAAAHLANAPVQARIVAWHVNQAAAEVTAVETKLHREFVSVRDFGAAGDGATDDTDAFLAAIGMLPNGGTINVPPGKYRVTAQVTLKRSHLLLGQGATSTIIQCAVPNGSWCMAQGDNDPIPNPGNPAINNFSPGGISDITLMGPGRAGNTANGLYLGGDPAGVITPANFECQWMRYLGLRLAQFGGEALRWGNTAYETAFFGADISDNGTPIHYVTGLTGSDENYNFHGGAIHDNLKPVTLDNNMATFTFFGTSLDYNIAGSIGGVSPSVECYGCYFENYSGPIINVPSTSSYCHIKIEGGLLNLTGAGSGTALVFINANGAAWVSLKNVRVESSATLPQAVYYLPLGGPGSYLNIEDLHGNFHGNIAASSNDLEQSNYYARVQGILTNTGETGSTLVNAGHVSRTVAQNDYAYGIMFQKRGNWEGGANAVESGAQLGYLGFLGWDGAAYGLGATIEPRAVENYTPTAHGSHILFATTPRGTTQSTYRMDITDSGRILMGTPGGSSGVTDNGVDGLQVNSTINAADGFRTGSATGGSHAVNVTCGNGAAGTITFTGGLYTGTTCP